MEVKVLRVLVAAMTMCAGLVVTAAPPAQAVPVTIQDALVTVKPSAEYTEEPLRSNPHEWTLRCPLYRMCATQPAFGHYIGFQFYKCQEYALTNWGVNGSNSTREIYNHQTVTVKFLGIRHNELYSVPPGYVWSIDFKPVWYIGLCN